MCSCWQRNTKIKVILRNSRLPYRNRCGNVIQEFMCILKNRSNHHYPIKGNDELKIHSILKGAIKDDGDKSNSYWTTRYVL